ncbi:MAG TPA: YcaO-like family protein, partial [Burkholderiaceae bacterium]|nr:YcaO-like family protein [Burkholderiaceae bacterium]
PVWSACRPNARSLAVSQGKGLDDIAAQVSAIMESIEGFHAEQIDQPIRHASEQQMRAVRQVVDVARLPRTARPFDTQRPIFWIEARDLTAAAPVWIPFELVHLNYTLPPLPGSGLFVASSNGLASGNHRFEAMSHALCEVIERDASTLWACSSEARQHRQRLNLASVDDEACGSVLERFARADLAVAVWDITSDVDVPAFSCAIADRVHNPMRPLTVARGMGCHPAREVALLRALTEAAQSRLTVISGSRDDLSDARYDRTPDEAEQFRRRLNDTPCPRDFRSIVSHDGACIDDDVAVELAALRAAGADQVLIVDLTRADFRIPVVRVLVPGLEALHDTPGFTPGPRARARLAEACP